jgi:hypothetical protein
VLNLAFCFSAVRFGRVPKREKAKILAAMQTSRIKSMECRVMAEMADESKMIETIVRAHYDTCDYTADKIQPFLARAHLHQIQTHCTGLVSTYYTNITQLFYYLCLLKNCRHCHFLAKVFLILFCKLPV